MSGQPGRSGRRRKPLAQHLLDGSYRADRHAPFDRGVIVPGAVVKPATLSPGAAAVWDGLAPACLALQTLTPADVSAFTVLCELAATFALLVQQKGTPGFDAQQERQTATALRPYYALFGLDPLSRSRLSLPPPAPTVPNPLDKFLIRKSKWTGVLP